MKPPIESLLNARVSASTAQGGRKYMEDEYCIVHYRSPPFLPNKSQHDSALHKSFIFLGIFDGHGGDMAARYTREHLCQNIVRQRDFWTNDDKKVCLAIHRGFVRTHKAMMNEVGKWPKTASGLPSTSGTTASVVFIMNGKYYTGHVGDSRIVLARQDKYSNRWIPCALTRDHKPESSKERRRIEAAGGRVMNKAGVGRVVWNRPKPNDSETFDIIPFLAVARSLGDLWSLNRKSNTFIVSPEPDVKHIPIDRMDRCLILASDGLWNMLSLKAAVNAIQDFEESQSNGADQSFDSCGLFEQQSHASALLGICLNRWSQSRFRADNTTVLAAMIDQSCFLDKKSTVSATTTTNDNLHNVNDENSNSDSGILFNNNSYYNMNNQDLDDDLDDMDNSRFVGDTIHSFEFDSKVESCFTSDDLIEYNNMVTSTTKNVKAKNDNNNNFEDEISSVLDLVLNQICKDYDDKEEMEEEVNRNQSPLSSVSTSPDENELSNEQLAIINFHSLHSNRVANLDSFAQNYDCLLTIDKCAIFNSAGNSSNDDGSGRRSNSFHRRSGRLSSSSSSSSSSTTSIDYSQQQQQHKVIFQPNNTLFNNINVNGGSGGNHTNTDDHHHYSMNGRHLASQTTYQHCSSFTTNSAATSSSNIAIPFHQYHNSNSTIVNNNNCDNNGNHHHLFAIPNDSVLPTAVNVNLANFSYEDENAVFAPSPDTTTEIAVTFPSNPITTNGHLHSSTYHNRNGFSLSSPPLETFSSPNHCSLNGSPPQPPPKLVQNLKRSYDTSSSLSLSSSSSSSSSSTSTDESYHSRTNGSAKRICSFPISSALTEIHHHSSSVPIQPNCDSSSSSSSSSSSTSGTSVTKLLHPTGQCIKELLSNGFEHSASNHHITDI